jgi:RHS repeat-associated protein
LRVVLRFPGQVFDAESGLHYNGFRHYDPGTGRYTQSDPIGVEGGVGTYGYAGNRPLVSSDPLGLEENDGLGQRPRILGARPYYGGIDDARQNINNAICPPLLCGATRPKAPAAQAAQCPPKGAKEVTLSRRLHGEAAQHAADAIKAGKPNVLTIDRAGAAANRQASTGALNKTPGRHLDEYPPAMFKEGGANASVRPINPRDNMSAGACVGNACRGLPDGTQVQINVGD